jgi:hypothetical protein
MTPADRCIRYKVIRAPATQPWGIARGLLDSGRRLFGPAGDLQIGNPTIFADLEMVHVLH